MSDEKTWMYTNNVISYNLFVNIEDMDKIFIISS